MSVHEIKKINVLRDVEYSFFDEDPDGEPDRAGDGYYYRIEGEDGWSGPWSSEDEAEDEARSDLALKDERRVDAEFAEQGFLKIEANDHLTVFVNKIDDHWFRFSMSDTKIRIHEAFINGGGRKISEIDILSEEDVFGERHEAALQALEALAQELCLTPPAM